MHRGKAQNIKEALWWEETCIRRQGGYDLDTSNLPASLRFLPKGTVLAFNSGNGKAIAVKSAKVYEAASVGATTLKVEANDLLMVGDNIGGSTISAMSVEDGIATLTIGELESAIAAGTVIADNNSKGVLLGLSYDTNDLRDNDFPQVTPTLQVYEIEEDSLPYPINEDIKKGLGDRHQFKIQ